MIEATLRRSWDLH